MSNQLTWYRFSLIDKLGGKEKKIENMPMSDWEQALRYGRQLEGNRWMLHEITRMN